MHCTIEQKKLYEALNSLQNITNKKGTLAILLNVLIETTVDGIFLTGTDLEIGLRIFIPAEVKKKGKITLPSKKFFEIVRESGTGQISLEEKENSWVHIEIGLSSYNLAGIPAVDFPEFPEYTNDSFIEIESSLLQELMEKTLYAVASEQENIYTLSSIFFTKEEHDNKIFLKMVSSDGHRLSVMEKEADDTAEKLNFSKTTLIPKKGVQEWKKFCDIRNIIFISLQNKQLILKAEQATMVIRLKDGEFPNYQAIINTVQMKEAITLERLPFLESLRRINLFTTNDPFHTISMEIDNKKITLSAQNLQIGDAKDEIDIKYDGEPLKLGFNCQYFIETLQVMESKTIEVFINSDASPCLIKSSDDPGFISIVMPMQIPS